MTDGRTDGGDCNIPIAFLKKRGDKNSFFTDGRGGLHQYSKWATIGPPANHHLKMGEGVHTPYQCSKWATIGPPAKCHLEMGEGVHTNVLSGPPLAH